MRLPIFSHEVYQIYRIFLIWIYIHLLHLNMLLLLVFLIHNHILSCKTPQSLDFWSNNWGAVHWLFKHGGFSYKSLTEDLEMEIEIVKSGGIILWNHHAKIYDEKPDSLKVSLRQRTRWAQGH